VFHQSIIRVRAGVRTDRGGNEVPDWAPGAVDRKVITPVSVQPASQAEDVEVSRASALTGWRVISAPGTDGDVTSRDRIEWDGMTLEVVGEVGRYLGFQHGDTHHIEFVMQRATG